MAEAAFDAAHSETQTVLLRAKDAESQHLLSAQGYLFIAPENLAALSGEMKEFFDRTYYSVLGHLEGRPYAQMICAGSDGENAVRQLARIATGWRLKVVHTPTIICTHAQTQSEIMAEKTLPESDLDRCREIGKTLATGLSMGIF